MHRPFTRFRSWLLAAFCGATALTFSCERKLDNIQPAEQAAGNSITSQDVSALQQAFAAAGHAAELQEKSRDGRIIRSWQPQWKSAFKEDGAVFVPLSLEGKTISNAKHFLVSQNGHFSFGLYIFPTGVQAELIENSPAFLRTFTGKLGVRRLGTQKPHLYSYYQGHLLVSTNKSGNKGAKSATGARGCVIKSTCYWDGKCYGPYGGVTWFLEITESTNATGTCEEPPLTECGYGWNAVWETTRTVSESICGEDIPDDPETGPAPRPILDGVYKITALHSGWVLGVMGGSTADGAQVVQGYDQGADNQKWQVRSNFRPTPYGNGYWVYLLTPYSNYLEEEAKNLPWNTFGANDQSLTILAWNGSAYVPTNANGAPAQIWRRSTSTATGLVTYSSYITVEDLSNNPFAWDFVGGAIRTVGTTTGPTFSLRNRYSTQYLDVTGVSTSAGASLQQWTTTGYPIPTNQTFIFTYLF